MMQSLVGYHHLDDHCWPLITATIAFAIMSGALMVGVLPGEFFFKHVKNPQVNCVPSRNTVINDLKMVA